MSSSPHSDIYRWAIVFLLDRLAYGLDAPRLGILSLTQVKVGNIDCVDRGVINADIGHLWRVLDGSLAG
jgi:hypothetical protein